MLVSEPGDVLAGPLQLQMALHASHALKGPQWQPLSCLPSPSQLNSSCVCSQAWRFPESLAPLPHHVNQAGPSHSALLMTMTGQCHHTAG